MIVILLCRKISNNNKDMTEFEQSVERFLVLNSTFLPKEKTPLIKKKLLSSESAFNRVRFMTLKDPDTLLWISLCVGGYGIDRFLINKKMTGALKLFFYIIALVCGVVGLLALLAAPFENDGWFLISVFLAFEIVRIIDLCRIRNMTREYNYSLIMNVVSI